MNTKRTFQLVALDLDGTLLNTNGTISKENRAAIQTATDQGVTFVIATGRPYCGLPLAMMEETGIQYAITANGASIYRAPGKECLFEDCMSTDLVIHILKKLLRLEMHISLFIQGEAYMPAQCREALQKITTLPDSLKEYILSTREGITDMIAFLKERSQPIQKLTLNFLTNPDGSYVNRDKTIQILEQYPEINYLSGGYGNLEFAKAGVTKGKGLSLLCKYLNIPLEQTIACGDSENDLDIMKTAGLGVAMANAPEDIRSQADVITLCNDAHGVAAMLNQWIVL